MGTKINGEYDIAGREISDNLKVDGQSFNTGFAYDLLNNQTSINYPNSFNVGYVYNNAGLIEKVKNSADGSELVKDIDYEATGAIKTLELGNGAITSNTYDRNKLYRLINKVTAVSGSNIQDISYTYDAVGNVTHISDKSAGSLGKEADYFYDDLYRLTKATITNTANNKNYTQAYSYDAIGNILNKSDVGKYVYDGGNILSWSFTYVNPDAVTKAGAVSYSYDNNGNLISDGTFNYFWDYANRLTSSVKADKSVNYAYDNNGQRILKAVTSGGSTVKTYYPNQFYDVENGEAKSHIYLGDLNIATLDNGNLYYNHSDHLNSSSIQTDSAGQVVESLDYFPFGSVRLDTKTGNYENKSKYIGRVLDSETNLDYLMARYYNAKLGRFISQDPLNLDIGSKSFSQRLIKNGKKPKYPDVFFKNSSGASKNNLLLYDYLAQPQQLNLYSYAINNPLTYKDPQGEKATAEKLFNFFAGRGWKTDAQLIDTAKIPATIAAPQLVIKIDNNQQNLISNSQAGTGASLEPARPIGSSWDARKKTADWMDKTANVSDALGEMDKIQNLAAGMALTAIAVIPVAPEATVPMLTIAAYSETIVIGTTVFLSVGSFILNKSSDFIIKP